MLLYGPSDALTQQRIRGTSPTPGLVQGFAALQAYVFSARCREQQLVEHFGGSSRPCGRCDVCLEPARVAAAVGQAREEGRAIASEAVSKRARDAGVVLDEAQLETILAFVGGLKRPVGKRLVAQGLRGGRSKQSVRRGLPSNPHFGSLQGVPEVAVISGIEGLLAEGRLARKGRKYPTVWLPEKAVRMPRDPSVPRRPEDTGLRGALKAFRTREARRRRWKPYQVFTNATLDAIATTLPTCVDELAAVPGIGPARIAKFSQALLLLVAEHA